MSNITLKLLIPSDQNSISYGKNYRIFSTSDPVNNITGFVEVVDDVIISSPDAIDLTYLNRYFRYSRNKKDWSLWYEIAPGDLGQAGDIIFEEGSDFYFEIKYEYNNGTTEELSSIIEINEIKLRFSSLNSSPNTFSPVITCSDETCNNIIAESDPSFKPYEVDSAIGMFKELSFYTNKMFGHDVVYFRTVPKSDSGDYIFKEWTLFKNVDRKCLKVLVPKNNFPSNNPKFTEFGLDFELPFEIHVDHRYFQSIFGKATHPRHRDFLYFPLINRMYEVTGSYLHRGFMMAPTYWKVSLQKYNPNIDMLLTDDSRHFLDNVIQSAEELFREEVEDTTSDALMPQQYDTISTTFDPSRNAIHPDLSIRPLNYNFNYASLISNYYDLSAMDNIQVDYDITGEVSPSSTSTLIETLESLDNNVNKSYQSLIAYQDSDIYKSWRNNSLVTTDKNVSGLQSRFIKIRGPLDSIPNHEGQSDTGRYIRIDAYGDLSFKKQKNIVYDSNLISFKVRESAVVYNAEPVFNSTDHSNLSYTALFNVNASTDSVQFLNGRDNETSQGIQISGQFIQYFGTDPNGDFTISLQVNGESITRTATNFKSGEWYAIVVSVSNEFSQCGIYLYSIKEDPADVINHTGLIEVIKSVSPIAPQEFKLEDTKYYIPSSNMLISNIRLFNTMIKEEDHEFILSQQYIKDESKLLIIDNCKPQINIPYISKNR
jgi:hypothetical protein